MPWAVKTEADYVDYTDAVACLLCIWSCITIKISFWRAELTDTTVETHIMRASYSVPRSPLVTPTVALSLLAHLVVSARHVHA